jgi:TnpA family transposase
MPGPRVFTNLANIQHARLIVFDANDLHHSLRGRNFTRRAHWDNIVSLAIHMTTSGIAGV